MSYKILNWQDGSKLLKNGDILLYRGQWFKYYIIPWIPFWLAKSGGSPYTHVELAINENNKWCSIGFREFQGSRIQDLETQVTQFPKQIDVFRPSPLYCWWEETQENIWEDKFKIYNGEDATREMKSLLGRRYGYWQIFRMAYHKFLFLRWFLSIKTDDHLKNGTDPVCSTSVAGVLHKVWADLRKYKPDQYMEPGDIAGSPLLNYLFTFG